MVVTPKSKNITSFNSAGTRCCRELWGFHLPEQGQVGIIAWKLVNNLPHQFHLLNPAQRLLLEGRTHTCPRNTQHFLVFPVCKELVWSLMFCFWLGKGYIIFLVAGTVLCFGFSMTIMLITLSGVAELCLPKSRNLQSLTLCQRGASQEAGGAHKQTSWPKQAKEYSIP